MDPKAFKELPVGSRVSHSGSVALCTYVKETPIGWRVVRLNGLREGLVGNSNLGNGEGVTLIDADGKALPIAPKIKRSVLEGQVTVAVRIADEAAKLAIELRERTREAERALQAERAKSTDLGTELAAERTRNANLRNVETALRASRREIASLSAKLAVAVRVEKARDAEPDPKELRGLGWEEFVAQYGATESRLDDWLVKEPLSYMKGYSFHDTRIVLLWGVNSYKAHQKEISALKDENHRLRVSGADHRELEARIHAAVRALGGKVETDD